MNIHQTLETLEKGDYVTLYLHDGQIIHGLFSFLDGDEFEGTVVLKPANGSELLYSLGWNIAHIRRITKS